MGDSVWGFCLGLVISNALCYSSDTRKHNKKAQLTQRERATAVHV